MAILIVSPASIIAIQFDHDNLISYRHALLDQFWAWAYKSCHHSLSQPSLFSLWWLFFFFFFEKREKGPQNGTPPPPPVVIELMTKTTKIRNYRSTGAEMPKPTRFHKYTRPLAPCTTASAEGVRPLNTTSFRWFHIVQSVAKMRCHSAPLR